MYYIIYNNNVRAHIEKGNRPKGQFSFSKQIL